MLIRKFLFVILFFTLAACVDRFYLKPSEVQIYLVVDGMVSDQPGPYTVRLTKSRAVNDQLGKAPLVTGATLTLSDDKGNVEMLTESEPGVYLASATEGVIGNSYQLKIRTPDGSEYESLSEKLLPVGKIDSLYSEFEMENPPDDGSILSKNGFEVYVDAALYPEQEGRVGWRWTGTFEIHTYPELKYNPSFDPATGKIKKVLVFPPCAGFSPAGVRIDTCSCCNCYITDHNPKVLLSPKNFVGASSISHTKLGFIPANRRVLSNKYVMQVEQVSMSEAVYEFWNRVSKSELVGSDLFQVPPASIGSNFKIVTKTNESLPILGVFAAGSIKRTTLAIHHDDVPYYVADMDTLELECPRVFYGFNSTVYKPPFY